jgi:hypothetical protein
MPIVECPNSLTLCGLIRRPRAVCDPHERRRQTDLAPASGPSGLHLFASSQDGFYARFGRALETGNLTLRQCSRRGAPADQPGLRTSYMPPLSSADAAIYERATTRWLGRFALEHPAATLAMLHQAVAAFERLPDDPEGAARTGGADPPLTVLPPRCGAQRRLS